MADAKIEDVKAQVQEIASESGAWDRGLVEASITNAKFGKIEVINAKRGKNDKAWDLMSWRDLWVKIAQSTVLPIKEGQMARRIRGAYDGVPYQIEIVEAESRFPAIRVASIEPIKPQIRFGYLVVDGGHVRLCLSTRPVSEGVDLVKTLVAARDKIQATAKTETPKPIEKGAGKVAKASAKVTKEAKVEEAPTEIPPKPPEGAEASKAKRTRKVRGAAKKAARAIAEADMALAA